ncbi:MAG: SDR family oxidoreductase [Pseudomonadota bacterium]|nr:SDR family oxidoreductase [Pseudomonadota bacterium]
MRILVTGGGGFIGAWIVQALAKAGHRPVVFDVHANRDKVAEIAGADLADKLDWITGDIVSTEDVTRAAADCGSIIHLAGLLTPACRQNPVLGANVNLIGTLNIFLAARAHGIGNVAYMSSMGVFGPDGGPEPHPTTLYGAFKLGGEYSARAFLDDAGITSTGFRPYVVYGPGRETGASAGPTLACRAAARGADYTIPFSGHIDMIHAQDVARIFLSAVQTPPPGANTVNLLGVSGETTEIARTIETLAPGALISVSGAPMPIKAPASEPKLAELFPDWRSMSLEQGLRDTIAHYRNHD